MAKYFLGSVGKAEAFRWNGSSMELMFVSKTLTNSGLSISTTKDDIRGGEGAPIQFSFYHDASVEVNLTDIQWKRTYVTAQLGAEFNKNPQSYVTEEVTVTAASTGLTLTGTVLKLPINCGEQYVAWYAKAGSDEWKVFSSANQITVIAGESGEFKAGDKYCVRYLAENEKARVAEITSSIIPAELFLIITAPIFAGDACAASKGKAAGSIQFEIPRFVLNGSQEFSMEMSSNQTMSLSGTAMASESAECDANGGKLLRIIEVIDDRTSEVVDTFTDDDGNSWDLYADGSITPHKD